MPAHIAILHLGAKAARAKGWRSLHRDCLGAPYSFLSGFSAPTCMSTLREAPRGGVLPPYLLRVDSIDPLRRFISRLRSDYALPAQLLHWRVFG